MKNLFSSFVVIFFIFSISVWAEEKISDADKVIIGKYRCYSKKNTAQQAKCYEQMYSENPQMTNWHSKRYRKDYKIESPKVVQKRAALTAPTCEVGFVNFNKKCISKEVYETTYDFFQESLRRQGCDINKAERSSGLVASLVDGDRRSRVKQNCLNQLTGKGLAKSQADIDLKMKNRRDNLNLIEEIKVKDCPNALSELVKVFKYKPEGGISRKYYLEFCDDEIKRIANRPREEVSAGSTGPGADSGVPDVDPSPAASPR